MTDRSTPRNAETAPSIRRRGRHLAVAFASAYAAGALFALGAFWFAGDAWWAQPLNVLTFWWSLPAVPLLLVALLARSRAAAALLALPALVFVWSYGGRFVPPSGATVAADLRVASFNTLVHTPDISHVERLVAAEQPDVLLLQEVFPERAEALVAALGDRYPHRWFGEGRLVGGVGLLSRYPILSVTPVPAATAHARPTAVVLLEVDGERLQVVPLHLTSPCFSCGPTLAERLDAEGDARRAEVVAVLSALDPEVPALVAGDLNSTERSAPYRAFVESGFSDPQADVGEGPGFTWPADEGAPWLRIDWVLTRGLVPVASWVGDGGPSDHRPVVVDVALDG